MLSFLSKLFGLSAQSDRALIDAAIERTIDGTDRRLRALGDYRKRLTGSVECAVSHVIALVDSFPASAEISRQAFGSDARVRAFFSSVDHLQQVLGAARLLRSYLDRCGPLTPARIYGLLIMEKQERTVLGTELEGDAVRRDVLQVAVNFSNHRYLSPAASEAECRWELKKRAFDYLIERALQRLTNERIKRGEREQQRRLLRRKLDAMRAGGWGLSIHPGVQESSASDFRALEAEIESIDAELGQFGSSALGLEESLAAIADTMACPSDWLASRQIGLRLDYRGIKRADDAPVAPSPVLELTELFAASGLTRIVLLGHVLACEIPERSNALKKAAHYLA